jgi:hypothetical protein
MIMPGDEEISAAAATTNHVLRVPKNKVTRTGTTSYDIAKGTVVSGTVERASVALSTNLGANQAQVTLSNQGKFAQVFLGQTKWDHFDSCAKGAPLQASMTDNPDNFNCAKVTQEVFLPNTMARDIRAIRRLLEQALAGDEFEIVVRRKRPITLVPPELEELIGEEEEDLRAHG